MEAVVVGSAAIARGKMKHFMPSNGLYLYSRYTPEGEEAIIMLNGQANSLSIDMKRYAEVLTPGRSYRDVLSGDVIIPLPDGDSSAEMTFTPRQILILEPVR